ncbi:hypothetical protein [Campylobacter geochelonis]|uniref:hypothetical protein n=1 Tax=Campylobacter geochelonis TaxID=1780362 RepID=UPI00077079CD|nr:hypothetical protein [Campylobacter geochelonis]CZE49210.1 Uncharacterised protein [Campylobacter geochelonis]CZE51307.1 Uncharacterised protein [Campylobacter geochelonis]
MKKILLFISLGFLIFISIWALFGKSSSEFLRDVKIILFFVILLAYIISLVVIAIGEKDVVKQPFLYALGVAVLAGISSGLLVSKSWFLVLLVAGVYVAVVLYLQLNSKTFSNKTYEDNV